MRDRGPTPSVTARLSTAGNYQFVDMLVEVPTGTGANSPRATWRLDGTLRITTSDNNHMQAGRPSFLRSLPTARPHGVTTPILRLVGDYDAHTSPGLWPEIECLIRPDGAGIIVDASEVTFFDASGMRVLVRASAELAFRSQRLTVRNPSRSVDRVLRLCGLEVLFDPPAGPPTVR